MKFRRTELDGVFLIDIEPQTDDRGWFARTFCKKEFAEAGCPAEFVQINQSFNKTAHTFRGFHFQLPPMQETKLIRCVSGSLRDFVIDLRKGSKTFLRNIEVNLSAENQKSILIPGGFAHGFLTLEDNTSLIYHHTQYYSPSSERGLRFDDPAIGLHLEKLIKVVSDRDRSYPILEQTFLGIEI